MDPEGDKLLIELDALLQRILAHGMAGLPEEKRQGILDVVRAGHAYLAIHAILAPPASDMVSALRCDLVAEKGNLLQVVFRVLRPADSGGSDNWVN